MSISENCQEGLSFFHVQSSMTFCLPGAHHSIRIGGKLYSLSLKGDTFLVYES